MGKVPLKNETFLKLTVNSVDEQKERIITNKQTNNTKLNDNVFYLEFKINDFDLLSLR